MIKAADQGEELRLGGVHAQVVREGKEAHFSTGFALVPHIDFRCRIVAHFNNSQAWRPRTLSHPLFDVQKQLGSDRLAIDDSGCHGCSRVRVRGAASSHAASRTAKHDLSVDAVWGSAYIPSLARPHK